MADVTNVVVSCACTLKSYFLLALAGALLWGHGEARKCADKVVKPLVRQCDPHLAAIQTAILLHTASANFSIMCSTYDGYVSCIETRLRGCESSVLHSYHINRATYSNDPYNCTSTDDVTSGYNTNFHFPSDDRKSDPNEPASQQFQTSSAAQVSQMLRSPVLWAHYFLSLSAVVLLHQWKLLL